MTATPARLVVGGMLAAAIALGSVHAAEPSGSEAPSATPSPRTKNAGGVVGDVDEHELQRKKDAAAAAIVNDPEPLSKDAIKRHDKAKAVQTGDDAKLRDLPSPARQGSE
jgi:hypothetical protein